LGEVTGIEWCHHTFNPWIGCTKVSAGCRNCYAEVSTFPRRQRAGGLELWGADAARHVTSEANWRKPLAWNAAALEAGERRRVFCASLADVFEDRPELAEPRGRLCELIEATPALDWLLLTKRPQNMNRLAPVGWRDAWPRNVWAGCTVEDQAAADKRIPHLLAVPAAVRFVSAEPLLGPLRVDDISDGSGGVFKPLVGLHWVPTARGMELRPAAKDPTIDWVIVGGESGRGARPFDLTWARSIVAQCRAARVPVFVKQLGAEPVQSSGAADAHGSLFNLKSRKGGDPAEWPEDLRVREFPW
jgi:protein gp37